MIDTVVQYITAFLPTIVALVSQVVMIAKFIQAFKKSKETDEYKAIIKQNEILIQELRETKKLNKQYLNKLNEYMREEHNDKEV